MTIRRQAGKPLFEHTPVLDNNLNINAMMNLVAMITIKTEITKTKSAASAAKAYQQYQQHQLY